MRLGWGDPITQQQEGRTRGEIAEMVDRAQPSEESTSVGGCLGSGSPIFLTSHSSVRVSAHFH